MSKYDPDSTFCFTLLFHVTSVSSLFPCVVQTRKQRGETLVTPNRSLFETEESDWKPICRTMTNSPVRPRDRQEDLLISLRPISVFHTKFSSVAIKHTTKSCDGVTLNYQFGNLEKQFANLKKKCIFFSNTQARS